MRMPTGRKWRSKWRWTEHAIGVAALLAPAAVYWITGNGDSAGWCGFGIMIGAAFINAITWINKEREVARLKHWATQLNVSQDDVMPKFDRQTPNTGRIRLRVESMRVMAADPAMPHVEAREAIIRAGAWAIYDLDGEW